MIGATAVALAAVGCSQDRPAEQVSTLPPVTAMSTSSSNSCQQNSHPGGTIIDKITTPAAWAMAVRDDGLAYFTEANNAGVGITSTKTKTLDGFIATGDAPTRVGFSPDGGTAYVANQLSGNGSVINVSTAQVVATISTPGLSPIAVQVSPDGSRLFIGTASPTVLILDTGTNQIIGSTDVGLAPNAFVVAPDNRIIYVSAFLNGTVTELDMFTGAVLRTLRRRRNTFVR